MARELQAGLNHCSVSAEFKKETELKVILKNNHHNMVSDLHAAFCCFLFSGTLLTFCSSTLHQVRNTDPNCYSECAVYEADVKQNMFFSPATHVEPTRQNKMACFHLLDRIFSFWTQHPAEFDVKFNADRMIKTPDLNPARVISCIQVA